LIYSLIEASKVNGVKLSREFLANLHIACAYVAKQNKLKR